MLFNRVIGACAAALLNILATAAEPTPPSTVHSEPSARPTLTGSVTDESGKPVEGATVYVWTAAVKTGYSTFCPSCYPDCGKSAVSGADGRFEIRSLDPDLLFNLMVAKSGFAPVLDGPFDPRGASPIVLQVAPRPPLPKDPAQLITGIVLDLDGKPIANARVTPAGITHSPPGYPMITAMGAIPGLEKFTMTDESGRFTLAFFSGPVKSWILRVDARGYAGAMFRDTTSEKALAGLHIGPGAIVSGRLMLDGKPVPDALMSLSHGDQISLRYLGTEYISTDREGRFLFSAVPIAAPSVQRMQVGLPPQPPADGWWLSVMPDSIEGKASAAPKLIHVTKPGQVLDVGDVVLSAPLHLKGRIILSDGAALPSGSRISAGLHDSSDVVQREIAADGSFDLRGLHANDWLISAAIPGYFLSTSNPNHFGGGLQGRLDKSVEGFVIIADPGTSPAIGMSGPPYKPFKSIAPDQYTPPQGKPK